MPDHDWFSYGRWRLTAAVTFAQAMGWLEPGTGSAFKQLPTADP